MTTPNYAEIYYKCRFCHEEMIYRGPFSDSLKKQMRDHEKKCPEYGAWIAKITKPERDKEKFELEGLQRAKYCLHFILQSALDISRLQAKLDDPSISDDEKQYKIARELSAAEAKNSYETKELERLTSEEGEENEIIRNSALKETERCEKMGYQQRLQEYRVF